MPEETAASFSAFISYASPDKEKAEEICASLEGRGFRCWIAPRNVRAGHEYADEIIRGIEQSRCLVLLLSEAANNSAFVRREVERAVSKKKPVFPVRIEDVMPSSSLELFVSTTHWIDAWTGRFIDHVDRLANDLSDESVIAEATAASSKIARKRRHLPTWVTAALAFVGIIVAVVIANHLSAGRGNGVTGTAPDVSMIGPGTMMIPKVDPHRITQDTLRPEMQFIIDTSDSMRIAFKGPLDVAGYLILAKMSYRIGEGTWRESYGNTVHFTGYNAWLEDMKAVGSITVKWDLLPERVGRGGTVGPFTYPIDYALQVRQLFKQRALDKRNWLEQDTKGNWSFKYLQEIFPAVTNVHFGTTSSLGIVQPIEQPASLFDENAVKHYENHYRRDTVMPAALKQVETVYMQLEFFDGTRSEVREQSRMSTIAMPTLKPSTPEPRNSDPKAPISIPDIGWQRGSPAHE